MRFMLSVKIPAVGGNDALKSGALMEVFANLVATRKAEPWFAIRDGDRLATMVLDIADASDMPSIAEPFWMLANAKVEFVPVMSWGELQVGVKKAFPG